MPKKIINLSGLEGLVSTYYKDKYDALSHPEFKTMGTPSQIADGVCDPIARPGYISPATDSVDGVTSPAANIRATITDTTNSNIYFLEGSATPAKLYEGTSYIDRTLITKRTLPSNAIGTDLEIYTINGVRTFFYSYRRSTASTIGIWDFSAAFTDNWFSNVASGGFFLGSTNTYKMIVADNGFMYVLDGSALHKVDGTTDGGANGTVTANVILFPATFQLIDGIDLRGNMWIAVVKTTTDFIQRATYASVPENFAGIYVWDRSSTAVNMEDFIPIAGVHDIICMFILNGIPGCFTTSTGGMTQIRLYNGNEFEIQKELDLDAHPTVPDGIHMQGDGIIWLGNDGIVYFYGNIMAGSEKQLYKIGDMTRHVTTDKIFNSASAILGVSSISAELIYYLCYDDTNPSRKIQQWRPHKKTGRVAVPTEIYSKVEALPKMSKVTSVTLFYPPETSGSGTTAVMNVDIYLNQSATSWGTTTLDRDDATRGWQYIAVGERNINFIQLGLTYSNNSMNFAITPSYAEVEYEVTTKKK